MIMKEKSVLSQIGKRPVTAKELDRMGVTRNDLNRLLAQDKILRIGRGVYQQTGADIDDENLFRAATMRVNGPSSVCLISALAFYNLTDEIPKTTWLLVGGNTKTKLNDIRLFRSRNPKWDIGIENEDGYRITSIERTIVDCLSYHVKFGNIGFEGLKNALRTKTTTLAKIVDMSKKLQVSHRIAPYIRVLL
jgi:predicted transcriptional regulator of viral defense system